MFVYIRMVHCIEIQLVHKMEKQTYAIIASILIAVSSFTYVGVAGKEPTHYCEAKQIKANCESLSSTNVTCYTLPAKAGGKTCTGGKWLEIPQPWQVEEPVITDTPDQTVPEPQTGGTVFKCDHNGCWPVR